MGLKKLKRFFINKINNYQLADLPKIKEWKIKPDDKICILAPHADDESIGCGGLLTKYGKQCSVILLTDGAYNATNKEKTQNIREEEFKRVMNFFGITNYEFMRAEDTTLIESYDKFKKLNLKDYDYIVMPHPLDPHKDHVVPQAFFKRLKKEQKLKAKAVYYEVWGAMATPTHYIDISDAVEQKRKAIDMYISQNNRDYADRILGLNKYRGIRHNIDYEEDYQIVE